MFTMSISSNRNEARQWQILKSCKQLPLLSPQQEIPLSEPAPLSGMLLLALTWVLCSLPNRRLDREIQFQSVIAFPGEEMLAVYFLYRTSKLFLMLI